VRNSKLLSLVNQLNRNPNSKNIIRHTISDNVDFAHIWINDTFYEHRPKTFFLIKNEEEFVGIVFDMVTDLHWTIKPKHRKKGHLTKALKEVILPYIFLNLERDEQIISIDENEIGKKNYINSSKLAKAVGFEDIDSKKFILKFEDFDNSYNNLKFKYEGLSKNEIENLKKEIQNVAMNAYRLNSKIEMALGKEVDCYKSPSLSAISDSIASFMCVIEDIEIDYLMESKD
jgi:hypothetical protein